MDDKQFQQHINNQSFFYHNVSDVQKAFETTKKRITKSLNNYFPYLDKISEVKIVRGTDEAMAKVPAYYNGGTFYYNYFDKPFNKRQISWIYLHETMPGHHYQFMLANTIPRSSIQKLFIYYGYLEGYAAYVEEIGYELNAYQDIYDELGKWEWDLIRSLRVAMDVGLNYYAWSDDKALAFWQKHIENKDDIAQREIARMKRWPAQVITYKYGADKILQWKTLKQLGHNFNLKDFHQSILEHGPIPFSILETILKQ